MLTVEVEREESTLKINRQLVEQVLALQEELDGRVSVEPPRIETLLGVKGAIEVVESEDDPTEVDGIDAEILRSLTTALEDLRRSRTEEGDRLERIITDQLSALETLLIKSTRVRWRSCGANSRSYQRATRGIA